MLMFSILVASYLPTPAIGGGNDCDVIVLNHTQSAGWSYTQLVMINDGRIVHAEWQPTFGLGKQTRWLVASEVYGSHIITVRDSFGEYETWRADQFIELRTPHNAWMKRFQAK